MLPQDLYQIYIRPYVLIYLNGSFTMGSYDLYENFQTNFLFHKCRFCL